MLEDPLRFILTTTDGAIESYNNLPSNVPNTGECTYENLVLATAQLSSGQLTLDQRNGSTYHSSAPQSAGYVSGERKDLTATFDRVSSIQWAKHLTARYSHTFLVTEGYGRTS